MSVRASIAQYICTQRASMTLATMVIADPPETWPHKPIIFLELGPSGYYLELDVRRAAMANVMPHIIPGRFPWR